MDSIHSTPLSRATLTGVFVGFITTLLSLIYNSGFRESTGFSPSTIINVSSLIFFINCLFLIIGVIFYAFTRINKGELMYIGLFALLTVFIAVMANNVHRSNIPLVNAQFHHLLVPQVIVMGLAAAFGIPYLFHNKKFKENVV